MALKINWEKQVRGLTYKSSFKDIDRHAQGCGKICQDPKGSKRIQKDPKGSIGSKKIQKDL